MKSRSKLVFGLVLTLALGACSSDDDNDSDIDTTGDLTTDGGDAGSDADNGGVVSGTDNGGVVSGTDNGEESGGSVVETDTSAIAGLWDTTEIIDGEEDVYYVRITEDGVFTTIDYDGDAYDQGENCYYIETASIQSIGGDEYVIQFDDEFEFADTETYTMIRNGNTLSVSYVDIWDDDDDGNTTETVTDEFPLLTGVDPQFDEC